MASTKRTQRIPVVSATQARPAAVVLVSGTEQYLQGLSVTQIRQQLAAQHEAIETHEVDAASYSSGELMTLASPSLFSEPRLIVVSDLEHAAEAFVTDALHYVSTPADDTVLVLKHGSGVRPKALLEAVRGEAGEAIGAIEITCAEIKKDADRLQFAQQEFSSLGAQISSTALRELVAAYTGPVAELAAIIRQLVSDRGQKISENDVIQVTSGRVEAGAFKVADAATAGRTAEALLLLRHALDTGTDPIPLLAALNMKVRAMARVFASTERSGVLAQQFSMAPWQVDRAMKETRGWTEAALATAIDLAAETELALKGGSKQPEYALEKYVLFISQKGNPAHTRQNRSFA